MSESDGKEHQRSHPREAVRASAEIRVDGHWHDCAIVNISPKGAKLKVAGDIGRGMEVLVRIGNFGEYRARIAWRQGAEAGVEFGHDPMEMTSVIMGLASYG
ncbi:MAG TPA: PilZ domain-containing protein [Gallionella sp.]